MITLHDLAPQLHSEDFAPSTRAGWRLNIRAGVHRAKAVTTVSEFVKRQLLSYFDLEPDRVLVAPVALDPRFHPVDAQQTAELARSLGVRGSYIVAVGGATRRGLPVAIDAWRQAKGRLEREVELVVVGEPTLPSEDGLVSAGSLDDETWPLLLAGARALCYPTRYEGFGLPALEAMASGTPVVCARVASLPEVLGDAACWTSEPTSEQMADALARLLSDSAWHAERRSAGLARAAAAPTWRESAAVLAKSYELAWFYGNRK